MPCTEIFVSSSLECVKDLLHVTLNILSILFIIDIEASAKEMCETNSLFIYSLAMFGADATQSIEFSDIHD